jgi:hypothetical protein
MSADETVRVPTSERKSGVRVLEHQLRGKSSKEVTNAAYHLARRVTLFGLVKIHPSVGVLMHT